MTINEAETGNSRLLVISDIHGYRDGLLQLLHNAGYNPGQDRLLMLGDYIDADNHVTWSTLDIVRELADIGAIALPGNQELKLVSMLKRVHTKHSRHIKWIKALPGYILDNHYMFVHAGVRPGRSLVNQSIRDMTEIREAFYEQPLELLEHTIGARGIVFGHTPTNRLGAEPGAVWTDSRRIGIDTGAKHGNRLTLLDLSGGIAYSCATGALFRCSDFRTEQIDGLPIHVSTN